MIVTLATNKNSLKKYRGSIYTKETTYVVGGLHGWTRIWPNVLNRKREELQKPSRNNRFVQRSSTCYFPSGSYLWPRKFRRSRLLVGAAVLMRTRTNTKANQQRCAMCCTCCFEANKASVALGRRKGRRRRRPRPTNHCLAKNNIKQTSRVPTWSFPFPPSLFTRRQRFRS